MTYPSFSRLAGLVIVAAGFAVIAFNAVLLPRLVPAAWEYPGYLALNSLLVFALTALYLRHLPHSGVLLHLGYALSAAGLFANIGFSFYAVFAFPILRAQFPDAVPAVLGGPMGAALMAGMVIGVIGNLMFYVAVLLARQVPRWAAIVLIASAVLAIAMLPYNISAILGSIGLVGSGVSMLTAARRAPQHPLAAPAD